MSSNIKVKKIFLSSCAAVLGGSLFALATQPAQAAGENSFRTYREQHAGMDRHTARRMFQAERRADRDPVNSIPANSINATTTNFDVVGVCSTGLPTVDKHEVRPREVRQSLQVIDNDRSIRLSSAVNLDLSSADRNITLGSKLFVTTDSIEITSGGVSKTVTAGSQVSAAEYVAVKQVLGGSGQKVSIDKSGRATGGEVDLGAVTTDDVLRASNFVNAENVTAYGDFGRHSDFRLNGDFSNYGTVNALSSAANVRQGAIRAIDITNHEGASINSSVDLTLDASGALTNKGSINSTGSLTLSAGSSIDNSGSSKASSHVALNSATINNQGTIVSDNGDVNLNGVDAALTVNNIGGTLSAVNGAINLRDHSYTGTFDSSIYGGDLFSTALNLNAGQGLTSIDVGQVTGLIYQSGNAAHVKTSTDVLNIGQVCLTGDPTFYNTAGDINLNADFTVGEKLTIVASGNIIVALNVDIIAGDANRGYDITLIAGAAFTVSGGNDSPTVPPLTGAGSVTLSGKSSKTGGSILFDSNTRLAARSTDSSGNHNGADVNLFAFGGKAINSGVIDLHGCNVVTGGKNGGDNGDILIVAGASGKSSAPVNGVITGVLDTAGGSGAAGDLAILTIQPIATDGPVTYDANGARTSESQLGANSNFKFSKGSNILIGNPGAGREHNISGTSLLGTGGEIYVQGDVFATGLIDWFGKTAITDGSAPQPIESALSIRLNSEGNIGVDGDPLTVKAPEVLANSSGDLVALDIAGNGTTVIGPTSAGEIVSIESETGTIASTTEIKAPTVLLTALDFGTVNSIVASAEVGLLKLGSGVLNSTNFTSIQTPKLSVITNNANIGSIVNQFDLPNSVKFFNAVSATGLVFVSANSGEDIKIGTIAAASVDLDTVAGLTIVNGLVANTGAIDVQVGGGTLAIEDSAEISAVTGVTINNNGLEKSKIAIGADVAIIAEANTVGLGNVVIALGAPGPVSSETPANIVVTNTGGVMTFTGSQKAVDGGLLKAKTPDNNFDLDNANITINNGSDKAGKFTLGGNVSVVADPPVPEGTPTTVERGPAVDRGGNRDTSAGASILDVLSPLNSTAAMAPLSTAFVDANSSVLSATTACDTMPIDAMLTSCADDSYMIVAQPLQGQHDASICASVDLGFAQGELQPTIPHSSNASLTDGKALFAPSEDMTVTTPEGEVKLKAGSIALILVAFDQLSVFNLHDDKKGGVSLEAAGRAIDLSPGRHISIASERAKSFADVNPIESVGHRCVAQQALTNGKQAFSSEFSILALVDSVKPLKAIVRSDKREAKKLSRSLIKTAAILLHLTSGSNPYEFHCKPRTVALNGLSTLASR